MRFSLPQDISTFDINKQKKIRKKKRKIINAEDNKANDNNLKKALQQAIQAQQVVSYMPIPLNKIKFNVNNEKPKSNYIGQKPFSTPSA